MTARRMRLDGRPWTVTAFEDGRVRFERWQQSDDCCTSTPVEQLEFTSAEWCALIASTSADGDTANAHERQILLNAVTHIHMGRVRPLFDTSEE